MVNVKVNATTRCLTDFMVIAWVSGFKAHGSNVESIHKSQVIWILDFILTTLRTARFGRCSKGMTSLTDR